MSMVADLWLATIYEAANETLPVDVAQGVVGKLKDAMANWQDKIDPAG